MTMPVSVSVLVLFLYFGLVLVVSRVFSRHVRNLTDFFLAGRTLPAWPVAIAFVSSWFGAGSTLGSINAFHARGFDGIWDIVVPSVCSCLIITFFFARRVARHTELSQPEAVEKHYGRLGRFLLSLTILASTTAFIASQMVAAGSIFHSFFGL